jgi:hypothetical protein
LVEKQQFGRHGIMEMRKRYAPGSRKGVGGRPKKCGEVTKQVRVPVSIADNIEEIHTFLIDLEKELQFWESEISTRDIAKNPRYSKARELSQRLRGLLEGTGINTRAMGDSDATE